MRTKVSSVIAPMTVRDDAKRGIVVRPGRPFNLSLSLRDAASLFPLQEPPPATLRVPIDADGRATASPCTGA